MKITYEQSEEVATNLHSTALQAMLVAAACCSPSSCSIYASGHGGAAPLSTEAHYLRGRESIKYMLRVTNTRTDQPTEHASFSMDLSRRFFPLPSPSSLHSLFPPRGDAPVRPLF